MDAKFLSRLAETQAGFSLRLMHMLGGLISDVAAYICCVYSHM